MTAFLFIGQGVALPWVAHELLDQCAVASLLEHASNLTAVDLRRVLTCGGRELDHPEILQPAIVAVCLGVHRLLEHAGVVPAFVVGHSLGELTAWAAGGAISDEDAVTLAALRGTLMVREAARHPGGMLRIQGDRNVCDRALAAGATVGSIWLGAHNGPNEYAVSGDERALALVLARFPAARLPVAGAWHSPAMTGAVAELSAALDAVTRRPLRARMISNRDGGWIDDDNATRLLAGQLDGPVQWATAVGTLMSAGARRLVAVGPGKMLRALVHANLGVEYEVEIVDSSRAIEQAAARTVHAA